MAQRAPDEPEDDVPAWVMTFSDVITLLMTFFILLLTFATNTPETFDRMQAAVFGGGGATGFAGTGDGMEKDDLLLRERSRSARLATEGSKMAPILSDPSLASVDKGIAGLEEDEHRVLEQNYRLRLPLDSLVDKNGKLQPGAANKLGPLIRQIKQRGGQLDFFVSKSESLERAMSLTNLAIAGYRVPPSNIGTGVSPHQVAPGEVVMVFVDAGAGHGAQD